MMSCKLFDSNHLEQRCVMGFVVLIRPHGLFLEDYAKELTIW